MSKQAKKLVFENGVSLEGTGFGADAERVCEVVVNTAMAGYQEIVSDSGYYAQLVCMSYPLIGNYGMTDEDYESKTLRLGGLIVREYNDSLANFRASATLEEIMIEQGVPGIEGVDTRRITRMLRNAPQRALLCAATKPHDEAMACLAAAPPIKDAVKAVSCTKKWYARAANVQHTVVAIDCGLKNSILASLARRRCNVTVVPYNTTAEEVLALSPGGVLIAGGPGNPQDAAPVIELVRSLWGKLPLFGIGLGMQVMALAAGCETYALPTGHRGGNHPVLNVNTGKIETTSQNHGYAVKAETVPGSGLSITHKNLLDSTVEGIASPKQMAYGVQYHPEGSIGAQDSAYLYNQFVAAMQAFAGGAR